MPKAKTSRKQLFRAALDLAGLTAAQWAEGNDITANYLSMVLNGKNISQRLNVKIDAFVKEQFSKHSALAS